MPQTSRLRFFYLAYLSKPVANRLLYRLIPDQRILNIVEMGVGTGQRAARLIESAAHFAPVDQIRYTGIDLFEARTKADGPGLTLKEAHRLVTATGARVRLYPGDPFSALARAANTLTKTDLVVIAADQDPASLAKAWFYVPRMLHSHSQVYCEETRGANQPPALRLVSADEIAELATVRRARRAA